MTLFIELLPFIEKIFAEQRKLSFIKHNVQRQIQGVGARGALCPGPPGSYDMQAPSCTRSGKWKGEGEKGKRKENG